MSCNIPGMFLFSRGSAKSSELSVLCVSWNIICVFACILNLESHSTSTSGLITYILLGKVALIGRDDLGSPPAYNVASTPTKL
jgi:hypothetical protein